MMPVGTWGGRLGLRRREFITLLGGAAAAWPLAARAQQPERMRRVGVLMNTAADSADGQARFAAFVHGLKQLGWTDGRNARLDVRWAAGDPESIRRYAAELVALAPDVILASGGTSLGPLRQVSRTVPTVFTGVSDPVGAGFVDSLARPGGNATGFIAFEWNISGKWLELLKEIAPGVTRAVVLRDTELGPAPANLPSSRRWRLRCGSRSTRSTWAAPLKSSALSRPLRALRMAA